jgi:hypothetical protein
MKMMPQRLTYGTQNVTAQAETFRLAMNQKLREKCEA